MYWRLLSSDPEAARAVVLSDKPEVRTVPYSKISYYLSSFSPKYLFPFTCPCFSAYCSSICIILQTSILLNYHQIGDDTFQLEPSLLEDLTAQIATLASIYHKPGDFIENRKFEQLFLFGFSVCSSKSYLAL